MNIRYKVETQCGWKPPAAIIFIFLLIRNFFLQYFSLVQSYTSTQASTCIRLQPSLVLQFLLEGSYNPLAVVLADVFTSTWVLTYRRLQPSLFF